MADFFEFPKMARYSREVIVTEKIDGTNAQILIKTLDGYPEDDPNCIDQRDGLAMFAGSRTRWITPESDNFGFARWAKENAESLYLLGEGRHFGEWWGSGIQRGYGLQKGEKRFSLFNVSRWENERPTCCSVVPVLWRGDFGDFDSDSIMECLRESGSVAAPGFMNPEGIVIFHTKGNFGLKKTFEKDDTGKWDT